MIRLNVDTTAINSETPWRVYDHDNTEHRASDVTLEVPSWTHREIVPKRSLLYVACNGSLSWDGSRAVIRKLQAEAG